MVETSVLDKTGLSSMLAAAAETSRLMAPVKRSSKSFAFDWINDSREIALEYVRTILPPKQAIMPPR